MGKVYIGVMGVGGHKLWGSGRRKIDGRSWEGCGRHICRPYGVAEGETGAGRERRGRDKSLPYGLREREIVGRPALRLPRTCAGVGMISGHLCRRRRPRRPAVWGETGVMVEGATCFQHPARVNVENTCNFYLIIIV